tara:strand:+ start:2178 stop:2477 length:300 start_codon:yes stop_codon:yes gene_type:complete
MAIPEARQPTYNPYRTGVSVFDQNLKNAKNSRQRIVKFFELISILTPGETAPAEQSRISLPNVTSIQDQQNALQAPLRRFLRELCDDMDFPRASLRGEF